MCAFLLEKTQTEEAGVEELFDMLLIKYLPGYETSVQRLEAMERLAASANEYRRKYGQPRKEELEKIPVEKRKDFRAKGELLDPERK